MLGYIVVAFCIICIGGAFAIKTEGRWFTVLPIATSIIIFILYFFGLLHNLELGVWAVIATAFGGCVYLTTQRKDISKLWNFEIKMILWVFVGIYILQIGAVFHHPDEWAHWGLTVYEMFHSGILSNRQQAITAFKEYPPATALLEYMVVKINGEFSAAGVYRGMALFTVSFLLPLASVKDKSKGTSIMTVILLLIFPTIFFYAYTEALVDCVLGILFAAILYLYFSREDNPFTLITIGLMSGILTLTKTSGLALLVIAVVIMLADSLATKRFSNLLSVGAVAIGAGVAKCSWSVSMLKQQAAAQFSTDNINVTNIIALLKNFGEKEREIAKQFAMDFITVDPSKGAIKLSYIGWLAVLVVGMIYLYKTDIFSKKRAAVLGISMVGTFLAYSGGLLLMYYFVWGKALVEGSFYRYLGTCICGMLLLIFAFALQNIKSFKVLMWAFVAVLLLSRPEWAKLAANPIRAIFNPQAVEVTYLATRDKDNYGLSVMEK